MERTARRDVPEEAVRIAAGAAILEGDLAAARERRGTALFAHGSGSSRHSPRNRHVAASLQEAGLGHPAHRSAQLEEERAEARTGI